MEPKKLSQVKNGIFSGEFKSAEYFSQDPKVKGNMHKKMQDRMDAFIHDLEWNDKVKKEEKK